MFKFLKRVDDLENYAEEVAEIASFCVFRMTALEEYLGIEFFHGDKSKPHYRKKRVITKKLGRPRKIK